MAADFGVEEGVEAEGKIIARIEEDGVINYFDFDEGAEIVARNEIFGVDTREGARYYQYDGRGRGRGANIAYHVMVSWSRRVMFRTCA